jgi:hypothetical protein
VKEDVYAKHQHAHERVVLDSGSGFRLVQASPALWN